MSVFGMKISFFPDFGYAVLKCPIIYVRGGGAVGEDSIHRFMRGGGVKGFQPQ